MSDLRHELLDELGRGGQAQTWRGRDRESGALVAVKELSLAGGADFKAIELFEREAAVLRHLDHPAIPRYVDAYHLDGKMGRRFFLVQELVEGRTLARRLDAEGRLEVDEVIRIAREVLDVLAYLHAFSPPVVHRDIKPSNLMQRSAGSIAGSIALIDFGGVQTVLHDDVGGSTIVGTNGYMAPEQLMGRAQPASDLYGLGATMVHLLSGMSPAELPTQRMRPVWRNRASAPRWLEEVVDALLEPVAEDRPPSAAVVLEALKPRSSGATEASSIAPRAALGVTRYQRPESTDVVVVRRDADTLHVYVPPRRFVWERAKWAFFIAAAVVWGICYVFLGSLQWDPAWVLISVIVGSAASAIAVLPRLRNDHESGVKATLTRGGQFRIHGRELPGGTSVGGPIRQLHGTEVRTGGKDKERYICLRTDQGQVVFAPLRNEEEERWLRSEIDAFLNDGGQA